MVFGFEDGHNLSVSIVEPKNPPTTSVPFVLNTQNYD